MRSLYALRDSAELVDLLSGWQWQIMYAARVEGSSWSEIGAAVKLNGDQARTAFLSALDQQEAVRPGRTTKYRHVA